MELIPIELAILIAVTFGWFLGLVTPFTIKWMGRVASHAQLRLNEKRHQQQVLHGKSATSKQPALQQSTGTP